MQLPKLIDIEDNTISELLDMITRDKIIVVILFIAFSIITALSVTVACYIADIIAFMVAGVMIGQVLICFIILWLYTRLILYLKLNMED